MDTPVISTDYSWWPRRGAWIGAGCGLTAALYLEWYYAYGGGQGPSAMVEHLWTALFLGLPLSVYGAILGRFGLALSMAGMWALTGATVAWLAGLTVSNLRSERAALRPPAG